MCSCLVTYYEILVTITDCTSCHFPGQLKEIVLLTKSSGGNGGGSTGGCCGGGGGGPSDSYAAPPSSSYGAPSGGGGGGGYSGGGGWGRSFRRQSMTSYNKTIESETSNGSDRVPMIGEIFTSTGRIDYPDYQDFQDYQEPPAIAISNSTGKNNDLKAEPTIAAKRRSLVFNDNSPVNVIDAIQKNLHSASHQVDVGHDRNILRSSYTDEWQATAEKTSSNNSAHLNSNEGIGLPSETRIKYIPLLHGI